MNLSGTWLGFYTYGQEHIPDGISVNIKLQLEDNDGIITGYCNDLNADGIPPSENATINGVVLDNVFSFVKRYAFFYATEDYTTIMTIEDREPPNIFYTGVYNTKEGYFSGKWTFQQDSSQNLNGSGTWKMFRPDFFDNNK